MSRHKKNGQTSPGSQGKKGNRMNHMIPIECPTLSSAKQLLSPLLDPYSAPGILYLYYHTYQVVQELFSYLSCLLVIA